ncbi:3-phosphoshikimate 1-carboxyvinyltransferase [Aequorivita sp. H23M31]|uniref:3-phosphoshikimate 1-carboxyvinyltransferase n=1 Tax=Aequorivita ciconiae TaxID=2494375 RepID=A0A410G2W3_9FLAO|nr:3-phosphoshikimate 1-carboxyvinyltransferase [Aequorivita sp. H23M31]QAA81618.1 3-phosphoshikimate 1-carboxyvinyltransferase [Aequorivita sp. H23M31]
MKAILHSGDFPVQNRKIIIGGSKSESNRLLILKSLFLNIRIKSLSESDDTRVLEKSLKTLKGTVNIHHAGTAMRFLTAYYASMEGAEITLKGSQRMHERPIGILVEALRNLGADIEYLENEGFPPLKITGKKLTVDEVTIPADVSSQYISALMLIAPKLPNGLKIYLDGDTVSEAYIQMTLSLLRRIGVKASLNNNQITISPVEKVEEVEIAVESDWSSASYFYSLVALSENLKITLSHFSKDSLQGDSFLPEIYKVFGVQTDFNTAENSINLYKQEVILPNRVTLDLSNTPDLAQTIAVTCFGMGIACNLTGLQTLKIKETDRLSALKKELSKLGAVITIDDNSLQLERSSGILPNPSIETYEDHRMAMAFAPLAVKTDLIIEDAQVVSKSYPEFWKDLKMTGINCDLKDLSK